MASHLAAHKRTLILLPIGALTSVFGGRSLHRQMAAERYDAIDTAGAAATLAMGLVAMGEGVCCCLKKQEASRKAFLERQRRSEQREATADLNKALGKMDGKDQSETVLVLISADDYNNALKINDHFKRNIMKLGNHFTVQCVYIEKQEQFDDVCDRLAAQGKTIRHVVVSAHGNEDHIPLVSKNLRDYLQKLDQLETCILISCFGATVGGEAEQISRTNDKIRVYGATASLEDTYELYVQNGKPGMFAVSDKSIHPLTCVYGPGAWGPPDIEEMTICGDSSLEHLVIDKHLLRRHDDMQAYRQAERLLNLSEIRKKNQALVQPGIDPQNRVLLLISKEHWEASAIPFEKLQAMYPDSFLQYAYVDNPADVEKAIAGAPEKCRIVALGAMPSSIQIGASKIEQSFKKHRIERSELLFMLPEPGPIRDSYVPEPPCEAISDSSAGEKTS